MQPYQPLYLKYRPQSLSELVGQHSVAQTLTNAIANDRISHAYLFTGPRGTGKTSSARILAKSLNCQSGPTATPCLTCASCLEIKIGNSPSVFEIDAASNNSVDDARALIERAPLVAQGGRYKLYIIDECHMLTKEAFNALLKTIEEPPPNVVFILATTEEHKVPPTIVSRCQRLMFKLVNQKELTAHLRKIATLENIHINDDALDLVSRRSAGGLRDALGLLDQASLLSSAETPVQVNDLLVLLGAVHEDVLLEISEAVRNRDGGTVLTAAHELLMDGREPAVLVVELAKHFLNLAKASYINETGGVTADSVRSLVLGSPKYLDALVKQAKQFDRSELAQMVEYLDRLEQTCRRSSQPFLSIEMGLLALCHRHDITYVRELEKRLKAVEDALSSEGPRPAANTPARPHKPPVPAQTQPATSTQHRPSIDAQPVAAPTPRPTDSQPAIYASARSADAASVEEHSVSTVTAVKEPVRSEAFDHDDVEPEKVAPVTIGLVEEPASVIDDLKRPGGDDIDEFWSDVLEALQNRHIPTYSIVKTYAFPVSFNKDDFLLGVRSETFQTNLERKIDHLKAACSQIAGRPVSVKIKVIADTTAKSTGVGVRAKDPKTESKRPEPGDAEEPESSHPRNAGPPNLESTLDEKSNGALAPARPIRQVAIERKEGTVEIHDAYRVFEGPGSRLIG